MYSVLTIVCTLFVYMFSAAQAQSENVYPFIVQKISETHQEQSYPNTAGSSNSLFVAAYGGPHPANDPGGNIPLSNRVFTILAFQGIPPTARNCELRVNIPREGLLWQVATSLSGAVEGGYLPTMFLYPLKMPITERSSWTWNLFASLQPENANGYEPYTGVYFTQADDAIIYSLPQCPGVSGPSGGVVGFVFGMETDIPFATAEVFLAQDYSDSTNVAGVYLRYTF